MKFRVLRTPRSNHLSDAGLSNRLRLPCWAILASLASSLVANSLNAEPPPGTEPVTSVAIQSNRESPTDFSRPVPVRNCWNIRYQSIDGDAGLADLHVPRLEGDEVMKESTKSDSSTVPIRVEGRPRPVVIAIHGGGWASGDKFMMGGYAKSLAAMGMVVLNINYRHAPEYPFPAPLDDVRAAMLFLRDNAETLSLDMSKLGLFGYSAGGHLSLTLALVADEPMSTQSLVSEWASSDPRWQNLPTIRAVMAGGPPCDFQAFPLTSTAMAYFLRGTRGEYPELYRVASPLVWASAGDPPVGLVHGDKDIIVPVENSLEMAAALRGVGVDVTMTLIPNAGHLIAFVHPDTKVAAESFFQRQWAAERSENR